MLIWFILRQNSTFYSCVFVQSLHVDNIYTHRLYVNLWWEIWSKSFLHTKYYYAQSSVSISLISAISFMGFGGYKSFLWLFETWKNIYITLIFSKVLFELLAPLLKHFFIVWLFGFEYANSKTTSHDAVENIEIHRYLVTILKKSLSLIRNSAVGDEYTLQNFRHRIYVNYWEFQVFNLS